MHIFENGRRMLIFENKTAFGESFGVVLSRIEYYAKTKTRGRRYVNSRAALVKHDCSRPDVASGSGRALDRPLQSGGRCDNQSLAQDSISVWNALVQFVTDLSLHQTLSLMRH